MEKVALFCYGTLQSPMVMKAVTGRAYTGSEAVLQNWARFRVRDSEYAGIVQRPDSLVIGKLYCNLDAQAMAKLDDFEGEKYERVRVRVTCPDGAVEDAYTYAIRDDFRDLLSDDPWDFDKFIQNGLERFIHWFVEDRRYFFDRGDL
ncbi:MAG: gamma-glutamylcyclotransferase family protein [Desulfobulbus sp.]|jgi:gamma-glutamylcyclotransferase (GGCT)/AIG2-like uncharacterized protein YtfP